MALTSQAGARVALVTCKNSQLYSMLSIPSDVSTVLPASMTDCSESFFACAHSSSDVTTCLDEIVWWLRRATARGPPRRRPHKQKSAWSPVYLHIRRSSGSPLGDPGEWPALQTLRLGHRPHTSPCGTCRCACQQWLWSMMFAAVSGGRRFCGLVEQRILGPIHGPGSCRVQVPELFRCSWERPWTSLFGRCMSVTFDDLAQLFAGLAVPSWMEDSRRALGHFASKHGCTATMRYSERRGRLRA